MALAVRPWLPCEKGAPVYRSFRILRCFLRWACFSPTKERPPTRQKKSIFLETILIVLFNVLLETDDEL
jgi:hypothetical protein